MRRRTVSVFKRENKDETVSFYIRWAKNDGSKGHFVERSVRTSPQPTKRELKTCLTEAWSCARAKEKAFNEDAGKFVVRTSLVDAAARYIREMDGDLSDSTVDRLCRVLPEFVTYLLNNGGDREIHKLLPHRVVRYRDFLLEKQLNKSTVCCYLSDISGWLKWCVGESYCTDNAASKKRVNYPRRSNDRVSNPLPLEGAEQYWRLISEIKTDWQVAVIGVLACSGLRVGEARNLEWFSYRPQDGTLSVLQKCSKTKKHQRTIPTCDCLRGYLLMLKMINDEGKYIVGTDEGRKRLTTQATTILRPFGITPHDLRRWFRTALETTSPRQFEFINDILGHQMARTRSAYSRRHNIEAYKPIMDRFNDWLMEYKPDARDENIIPPDEWV